MAFLNLLRQCVRTAENQNSTPISIIFSQGCDGLQRALLFFAAVQPSAVSYFRRRGRSATFEPARTHENSTNAPAPGRAWLPNHGRRERDSDRVDGPPGWG